MTEIIGQIIVMALLTGVGVLCGAVGIVNKDRSKCLSDIALKIATPALIVTSFQREYTDENASRLLYSLILAVTALAVSAAVSYLLIHRKGDKDKQTIERFSAIYTNCGFIGIPLINGVYGEEGVFYLTAFYALFNLTVWSHGLFMMKGGGGIKNILGSLKAPAFIAVFVGLALFLLRIDLPDILDSALGYVGDLTTPLGMIVAGATIAGTKKIQGSDRIRICLVTGIRLLLIPAIVIGVFLLFPFDGLLMGVNVIAIACPAAAVCTMFAVTYNKDSLYASQIFAVTTVLSALTLPLVMKLFEIVNPGA